MTDDTPNGTGYKADGRGGVGTWSQTGNLMARWSWTPSAPSNKAPSWRRGYSAPRAATSIALRRQALNSPTVRASAIAASAIVAVASRADVVGASVSGLFSAYSWKR